MVRAGAGSIINMSSGAEARTPLGNHLAYGAAKGALEVLTTYAAATFGHDGVRCNAIAPGFVTTEKALELFSDGILEGMRERSAAGRLAVPDDDSRLAGVPRVGRVVVRQWSGDRVQRGRCSGNALVAGRAR